MNFYPRYVSWGERVSKVIDALHLMAIEADWRHILENEQNLEKWLTEIKEYDFWIEFEGFALTTEQNKVEAFFLVVNERLTSWLRIWKRTYNHEDHEEFKDWFYNIAYTKLHKTSDEANRVARLITQADNVLMGILHQFEQLKSTYTKLPPRIEPLFYERVKDKFLGSYNITPYYKYTYEDWLNGDMDKVLVRHYLSEGDNIKPFIWPERWELFNQWLEAEYRRPMELFDEIDWLGVKKSIPMTSYTIDELIDLFVKRIIYHEGDKHRLFRHQVEFFPIDERKKIWSEMARIHTQIIIDNWYHWQKYIDKTIQDSIDARKFINDTIKVIDHYFEGQAVELVYPLYKPLFVSQQAIISAYQSLLRGHIEYEYCRPLMSLRPDEDTRTDEEIKNHKPQHPTDSPYIEAELLLKAKEYLKQRLIDLKPTKAPKTPSEYSLFCTLTEPQIKTLFIHLSVGRFIDSAVKLTDFSDMLLGVEPIPKPVQWLKSNRDLAYLLNTMFERGMINSRIWKRQVEKRCLFLNEKNKPLKAQDLAQAISDYQTKGNPAETSNIDTILDEVKACKD